MMAKRFARFGIEFGIYNGYDPLTTRRSEEATEPYNHDFVEHEQ
jgi:hypothetical protein